MHGIWNRAGRWKRDALTPHAHHCRADDSLAFSLRIGIPAIRERLQHEQVSVNLARIGRTVIIEACGRSTP